mmetsp:Transcript_3860/g.15312  ORF Transcript_3860/g.15312 Transcript_3860/m.15312 type:complete len:277 (-) Transcript_3860:482-1312(-)
MSRGNSIYAARARIEGTQLPSAVPDEDRTTTRRFVQPAIRRVKWSLAVLHRHFASPSPPTYHVDHGEVRGEAPPGYGVRYPAPLFMAEGEEYAAPYPFAGLRLTRGDLRTVCGAEPGVAGRLDRWLAADRTRGSCTDTVLRSDVSRACARAASSCMRASAAAATAAMATAMASAATAPTKNTVRSAAATASRRLGSSEDVSAGVASGSPPFVWVRCCAQRASAETRSARTAAATTASHVGAAGHLVRSAFAEGGGGGGHGGHLAGGGHAAGCCCFG